MTKTTTHKADDATKHPCPPNLYSQSLELELLAAIVNGNMGDVISQIDENGSGEAIFTSREHQQIYRAAVKLYNEGITPDLALMSDELSKQGFADAPTLLLKILTDSSGQTGAKNAQAYLDRLIELAKQRKHYEMTQNVCRMVQDPSISSDEVQDYIGEQLIAIDQLSPHTRFYSLRVDGYKESIKHIEDARKNGGIDPSVVSTGFSSLDDHLNGGLHPGELTVIAARTGVGKSALAGSMALRMVEGGNVLLLSLEMSCKQLADRALSIESGVPLKALLSPKPEVYGQYEDDRVEGAYEAAQTEKYHIIVTENRSMTIEQVRTTVRRAQLQHNISAVFIDYLQLIDTAMQRGETEESAIRRAVEGCKRIAVELRIPVVALAQLNRKVEERGGRPKNSDLRGSGAIEHTADNIILIHLPAANDRSLPPDYSHEKARQLIIGKARQGETGGVWVVYDGSHTQFLEKENIGENIFDAVEARYGVTNEIKGEK